jgi:predicted CoA-binding protein
VGFKGELKNRDYLLSVNYMGSETDDSIAKILGMKMVAVVGLSKDPSRPSYDVAAYLKAHGYRIVPVNPTIDEVFGEKSYKSLVDLPDQLKREIDIVDIFRRAEDVLPIVDQAIQLHKESGHPKVVWMQLGIVNEEAARKAKEAGLDVLMDHCMKIEHTRLAAKAP